MNKSTLLASLLAMWAALGASLPVRAEQFDIRLAQTEYSSDERDRTVERRRASDKSRSARAEGESVPLAPSRADGVRAGRSSGSDADRRRLRQDVERARDEVYGRSHRHRGQ